MAKRKDTPSPKPLPSPKAINRVEVTALFIQRLKRFARKFPTLPDEVAALESVLLDTPEYGTPLGAGLYKIRLGSTSKGGGKSGGFRIITYLLRQHENGTEINLLTIYDKSEETTIHKATLLKLVERLLG